MTSNLFSRHLVLTLTVLLCLFDSPAYGREETPADQILEWRKAAEQGIAAAQFSLGRAYDSGDGVPSNAGEAATWYRKAAEKGHAEAQCELAFLYQCGHGLHEDAVEAANWYRKAAEQGNITAQIRLGIRYMGGSGIYAAGVPRDEAQGLKWLEKASEQGDAGAALLLGEHFLQLNPNEGIKWLRLAADRDNANAQIYLGDYHANGKGPFDSPAEAIIWFRNAAKKTISASIEGDLKDASVNFNEAVKWYRKAAEQNDGKGQRMLGLCCHFGLGLPKDMKEAAQWYCKAANKYDFVARLLLGYCYATGDGVGLDRAEALKWWRGAACPEDATLKRFIDTWSMEPEKMDAKDETFLGDYFSDKKEVLYDLAEAKKWYRKAADRGFPEAQRKMAKCSSIKKMGDGMSESAEWFFKAANQGDAESQTLLGSLYGMGYGIIEDHGQAAYWFRKAAEQDDAEGQLRLACCYRDGDGVIKDGVEAYKWALLATVKKDNNKWVSDGIEQILTREQIAEGQRLARNFKPRKAMESGGQDAGLDPKITGTGFLITRSGYLVTNHHVVKDSDKVRVQTVAGLLDAVVVRTDAASDLALLKVTGAFDALPVVSSRNSRLGSTVATVGFPNIGLQGFEPKLSKGEISSLAGIQDDVKQFQISVPVQPGNSGGALVDERGNVVGVVCAQLSQKAALESTGTLAQSVNYAIKSSYLLSFLEAVPEVSGGLLDAKTNDQKFEAVVDDVKKATVLIIGY